MGSVPPHSVLSLFLAILLDFVMLLRFAAKLWQVGGRHTALHSITPVLVYTYHALVHEYSFTLFTRHKHTREIVTLSSRSYLT